MFTIDQIKAVHARVKSGADFPAYIQELKKFGLLKYEHYLTDGHVDYYGMDGFKISAPAKWPVREIAANASVKQFREYLEAHQQGKSDYPTICLQAAACGVEKWIVDLVKMTCIYYNNHGEELITEEIPEPIAI